MNRKFINMYLDTTSNSGYWIVEYLDEDGILCKTSFDTDLDARDFYNILIQERTI